MSEPNTVVGAVDVGGTKIAVGLVSPSGQILEQEVAPTARDQDFTAGLAQFQDLLSRCLSRRPGSRMIGVGVGCTGPVDPETGVLGPNSFLPKWEGVNTIQQMEAAFGLPVAIENDADAAALGEAAWGAGQGASRCVYMTVSTGIGCGIILDGHVYRGAGGSHPELGHLILDTSHGPQCYCGGKGCWESLASGPALAAWYGEQRIAQGLPDDPNIDAREICRRAAQGEALAQAAVDREARYLGLGIANLISIYIPEVIVMGGGVMESWPMFSDTVHAIIRQTCGLVPYQLTELRRASLGMRTGLSGAARVWFHRYGG